MDEPDINVIVGGGGTMIKAYPKIFAIGTDYIADIFKEPVEITEKIDGSQFAFSRVNGELFMRSKGAQLFIDNPEKMFLPAIEYVQGIEHLLEDNTTYYCEYLKQPRHNVLKYDRIPNNHLMLFGVMGTFTQRFARDVLGVIAEDLNIESVPVLFRGVINKPEDLTKLLDEQSVLGSTAIEGIVVKNYDRPFLLGGQPIPIMAGKFVSEKFKETHKQKWGKEYTARGRYVTFCESFKTEARWHKAVQHLRDSGELENQPRDIGKLIKEIQRDIKEEEQEAIKNFLWSEFGKDILRTATRGFPEWYKEQLVNRSLWYKE